MIGKLEDEYKGQWPRHLLKLTHAYNSTRSAITSYSPHFLTFRQWPGLPIDFVFPIHEVMGTLRLVDSYVADLITAPRKAFKVAQNMTQTEALRLKRRCNQKVLTVTLNKGDVVLMRNDQFVGKRKLKDHWGDKVCTVCNQVHVNVPMYIIKNQRGQRQTLHQNWLFLIEKVDPEADWQVAVRLFNVASTQIGSEVQHWEMFKASTPPIEIQACAASPLSICCPRCSRIETSRTYNSCLQSITSHLCWMVVQQRVRARVFCCVNANKIPFWGNAKWVSSWPWSLVAARQQRL